MNMIDKIYEEWAWRSKTGAPSFNNSEDIEVLSRLYEEWGVLKEMESIEKKPTDTEENTSAKVSNRDLKELKRKFENIRKPYSRYLSVFYYFDPNSLGTISEILLAKLLEMQDGDTEYIGGKQGLADIRVGDHYVSLKTSKSTQHIGLGRDVRQVNTTFIGEKSKLIYAEFQNNHSLEGRQVKDLANPPGLTNEAYTSVMERLDAIADKLTGGSDKEIFVWVEKVMKSISGRKYIESINIHILNYKKEDVKARFLDGYLYFTGTGAWGLSYSPDKVDVMIQADDSGKYLSIHPRFIRETLEDKPISIKLGEPSIPPENLTSTITTSLLQSLDQIYNTVFKGTT